MTTIAKQSNGTYTLPPAGTHVARCYGIIDLGTQQTAWKGKPHMVRQVLIKWELCDEMMTAPEGEQLRPFSVTKRYTNSLNEKSALRSHLEAWLGRQLSPQELSGFALSSLLGTACQLTIVHESGKTDPSKTYANIKGISPLAKGQTAVPLFNPTVDYQVEQGKNATFMAFPERLQKQICQCQEWQEAPATAEETQSTESLL